MPLFPLLDIDLHALTPVFPQPHNMETEPSPMFADVDLNFHDRPPFTYFWFGETAISSYPVLCMNFTAFSGIFAGEDRLSDLARCVVTKYPLRSLPMLTPR